MTIDKNNCEAYFLDYYEGNLSKEGVEEMFAFLVLNPEMREVFDSYDEVSFSPDKQISFEGKSDLKKSDVMVDGINENNYEEYFVSEVERILSAEEKIALGSFLTLHPEKAEELEMLKLAILVPDESIVFEQKASLHKSILVSAENFEEMAIASVEGLLNDEEEKVLAVSITASVEQQKSFALYQQTKLTADTNIVFEDKASLKRRAGAFWWTPNVQFAAAAAVILFIGILFWNYSGNSTPDKNTFALIDSTPKNKIQNSTPKNQLANTSVADTSSTAQVNSHPHHKALANVVYMPAPVKENVAKDKMIAIVGARKNLSLKSSKVNPGVDFSDTYYSYTDFSPSPQAPVASNAISVRQAAMRWMKRKLDGGTEAQTTSEETYTAKANSTAKNGNVSAFDLTSSAVAALGNATGANIRLGQESEGTVLTLGKYDFVLSKNN